MKITKAHFWTEQIQLTRPYTIAYKTIEAVENIFVQLECDNGQYGVGVASPSYQVTGETFDDTRNALSQHLESLTLLSSYSLMWGKWCYLLENIMDWAPLNHTGESLISSLIFIRRGSMSQTFVIRNGCTPMQCVLKMHFDVFACAFSHITKQCLERNFECVTCD